LATFDDVTPAAPDGRQDGTGASGDATKVRERGSIAHGAGGG
jgi:hypothetical protein